MSIKILFALTSMLICHVSVASDTPIIQGISVGYIHSAKKKTLTPWYQSTLGLKPAFESDDWTQFDFPGQSSSFAIDQRYPGDHPVQKQDTMLSFKVLHLKSAIQKLLNKKVEFFPHNPQESGIGKWYFDSSGQGYGPYVASFKDPEGRWMQLSSEKLD